MNLHDFLEEVYKLSEAKDSDGALDLIFDQFDEILWDGRMSEIDALLDAVDVEKLGASVMLGFYSASYVARDFLSSRETFRTKIEQRLPKILSEKEANEILCMLR